MLPERLWSDGRWQEGAAVTLDERGRIAAVGPLADGANALRLPGCAVVPGGAWALWPPPAAADGSSARATLALAHVEQAEALAATGEGALEAHYAGLLQRAAAGGLTAVGVPLPRAWSAMGPSPWPGLDALTAAAAQAGLRVSLCFPLTAADVFGERFERSCVLLDAAVQRLWSLRDAKVTWSLAAVGPAPWPREAVVAARLRLGHLPWLLPLEADSGPAPFGREAWLAWHGCRGIDATVAALVSAAPSDVEAAVAHATGGQWLDARTLAPPAGGEPTGPAAWAAQARAHGAALALRAGSLRAGAWADFVAVPVDGATPPLGSRSPLAVWVAGALAWTVR